MSKHKVPEGEDGQNNKHEDKFLQLLSLLHTEDLIRCRRRAEKRSLLPMAEFLTGEIAKREALEKEERLAKKK